MSTLEIKFSEHSNSGYIYWTICNQPERVPTKTSCDNGVTVYSELFPGIYYNSLGLAAIYIRGCAINSHCRKVAMPKTYLNTFRETLIKFCNMNGYKYKDNLFNRHLGEL